MAEKHDPQLVQFMERASHQQRFQQIVGSMTEDCWDLCLTGAPGNKMDRKSENCLTNCVERFIDASNFILSRLEKEGESHLAQEMSSDLNESSTDFKWN